MRELPILFSAPMVRAILEGRKTVTRRACRDQPHVTATDSYGVAWPDGKGTDTITAGGAPGCYLDRCPYGQPGDRLYVRETTMVEPHPSDYGMTERDMPHTWAAACEAAGRVYYRADATEAEQIWLADARPWTPSIHMPKDRARIWLEVTAVRVERLRDISETDARVEGVNAAPNFRHPLNHPETMSFCIGFAAVWDSINGAGSWATNPWVWVIEFKPVAP